MRTSLLGACGLLIAGCGTFGHWGSSDDDPGPTAFGADGGVSPSSGIVGSPEFGIASNPDVPAISGGTIAISKDGNTAVVADPDRDSISIVDLTSDRVTPIALQKGDEPGRVVLDGGGRAHVALRRGGALVTVDLSTNAILARRTVCPSPRGTAVTSDGKSVVVACSGGELVTFPVAGGDATRTLNLDTDLRDVIARADGTMLVSRFRSAEVLTVSIDGKVAGRATLPDSVAPYLVPAVAWRMITPTGNGLGAILVHQRASLAINNGDTFGGRAAYYSGSLCDSSFTTPAVATVVTDAVSQTSVSIPGAVLPVDIASSPDGSSYAVVSAANGHTSGANGLFTFDAAAIGGGQGDGCVGQSTSRDVTGQLTSVAFKDNTHVVVFSREPAALYVVPTGLDNDGQPSSESIHTIAISSISREDTGHAIFHSNTGLGIACASCHAEGGDDGQVWSFSVQGLRRTPSLRGTIAGTAPYHWSGELADISALEQKIYEEGMSGPSLQPGQTDQLQQWLFSIPRPPVQTGADPAAVARGKALFEGQGTCSSCHAGDHFTNNTTVNVGTGEALQVPSLIGVSMRTPLLHTGCAATLADRFSACAGGDMHGQTSGLTSLQTSDLVSYLSTL